MKKLLSTLLVSFSLTLPSISSAQQVTPVVFEDQWEAKHELNAQTQWLVVSQNMDSGDIVKSAFNALEMKSLSKYKMIYVADISAMPSLISKFFALPKMRDFAFPIALIREDDQLKNMKLPLEAPEKVTVIALNNLNIDGAMYFSDQSTFEKFLKESVIK